MDISRVMYDAPEAGLSPMIARFYPEWKVDKSSIATFLEPSRYCKEGVFNVQQVSLVETLNQSECLTLVRMNVFTYLFIYFTSRLGF